MQIIDIMNLRSEFECITQDFKLPSKYSGSDINSLKWFIDNGYTSNSLRNGYQMANEIAKTIITEYDNGKRFKSPNKNS